MLVGGIMRKIILFCATLFTIVLLISASPVRAQSVLWVGPNGSDANACSQTAPCATFQGAINKGSVSQINCLSSGSYGAVIITASITIDCGSGNIGDVIVSSGDAITINTSSAAVIVLRHLNVNGLGSGQSSVGIVAAPFIGTLIVDDCVIQGFNSFGIGFMPINGRGLLQVSNSQIFGNFDGITVQPPSGQIASVTVNRVELIGNSGRGLFFAGAGVVAGAMRDTVVGANGIDGVLSQASQVYFTIEESSIVDNLSNGIESGSAGSIVNVGSSTIGGNGTGVLASQGSIISFGNNQMSVNAVNGTFTSTTPLQ
jgi:hypothetical protein